MSEKSETPQAHIPTLHDHSQKLAAQSESLKCSLLEKRAVHRHDRCGSTHGWIQPTWGFTSVFRQNLTMVNNNIYMWDVFSQKPHMQRFYNFRVRRFDRYAENALTCVNSHQTTPNLMKFLNWNFPHECDYIYSVPLVHDDFTLNLAFFTSFTRFSVIFHRKK